jgi:hypothetical protein
MLSELRSPAESVIAEACLRTPALRRGPLPAAPSLAHPPPSTAPPTKAPRAGRYMSHGFRAPGGSPGSLHYHLAAALLNPLGEEGVMTGSRIASGCCSQSGGLLRLLHRALNADRSHLRYSRRDRLRVLDHRSSALLPCEERPQLGRVAQLPVLGCGSTGRNNPASERSADCLSSCDRGRGAAGGGAARPHPPQ